MVSWRRRSVSVLICAGLILLAFAQMPGLITVDTKLDLTENPAGWFARAAHLWNEQAGFGQVENQAYGYFFPLGPFFWAGVELGIPPWVVQRLWTALILVLGYLGMRRLTAALRIGDEPSRHLAGLAWALAPRIITTIGPISFESLSMALLPWCLAPLVAPDRDRSPARPAAFSALAVLAMGGANGSVVLAVLVAPLLWLLAGVRDRFGRRLLGWWLGLLALAIMWWFLPLLTMSRYVGPFLERSESAVITSSRVSTWQALRGADHWVGSIFQHFEPWWPAASYVFGNPWALAATAFVAALGFAGLLRRDLPRRPFWLALVGIGLAATTIGYAGRYGTWYDTEWRQLLDGPFAAVRNVHKFDPLLRLPIVLGLAHFLMVARLGLVRATLAGMRRLRERGLAAGSGHGLANGLARGVTVLGLAGILVGAGPAFAGQLRTGPGFAEVPGYWAEAATWLGDRSDGTAYLAPGSGFGEYSWGRAYDDPLQPLAKAPWAVRNQVPMGEAGGVIWMDTVERLLASGQGSPALGEFLARAGVSHLVIRNDLAWWRTGTARPAVVHQAVFRSGGLQRAAWFGPISGRAPRDPAELIGYDVDPGYPAIEIFEVTAPRPLASLLDGASVTAVTGGPDSLLALLEDDLIDVDAPVTFSGDPLGPRGTRWVATDGLPRREINIGRVHAGASATMTAREPYRLVRSVQPYDPFPARHQTVVAYDGAKAITASSSEGYADSYAPTRTERQPYAAFDGDPATYWKTSVFGSPIGQWIEIELDRPTPVDHVIAHFADDPLIGHPVAQVVVTTDAGTSIHGLPAPGQPERLTTAAGLTTRVRLTVIAMRTDGFAQVALRELAIPGVSVGRTLRVPDDPPSDLPNQLLDGISLRQAPPRYACLDVGGGVRCDPTLAAGMDSTALDRIVTVREAGRFTVEGWALPRPGAGSLALVAPERPALTVVGSSTFGGDPAVAATDVVDGDERTAWVTEGFDANPTLGYRWTGRTKIDKLELRLAAYPAAAAPLSATLTSPAGTRELALRGSGTYPFPPLDTDQITVRFGAVGSGASTDLVTGDRSPLPVGVAELSFPALSGKSATRDESDPLDIGCGDGPAVTVAGQTVPTRVEGRVGDIVHHRPVRIVACTLSVGVAAGDHRIRFAPTDALVPTAATLRRVGAAVPPDTDRSTGMRIVSWAPAERVLQIRPGSRSLVVVRQNYNPGWVATVDGWRLQSVRLDGWFQGWIVPEGLGGEVRIVFEPDRTYRISLLAGAAGVLVLLLIAIGFAVDPLRRRRGGPRSRRPAWVPRLVRRGGQTRSDRREEEAEPSRERQSGSHPADAPWLRWILPLAVMLVGGLAGVISIAAASVLVALATVLLRTRRPMRSPLSVAVPALGCLVAAGILALTVESPTGDRVQLLSVIAVAGLAVSGLAEGRDLGRRPLALPQQRADEPVLEGVTVPALPPMPARRALNAAPAGAPVVGRAPDEGGLDEHGGEDGSGRDEQGAVDDADDRGGPVHDHDGHADGRHTGEQPGAPVAAGQPGGEQQRDDREPGAEGGEPPDLWTVPDEVLPAEDGHHEVAEEGGATDDDQAGQRDEPGPDEDRPEPVRPGPDAGQDDDRHGLRQPERDLRDE